MLFIADPETSHRDIRELHQASSWGTERDLIEKYIRRKLTIADKIAELFSTHPNLIKRLRALQEIA
ncbi:hypothetical protein DRO64_07395 [Candidatus Bathyarchaeota archaeon]|nr:MAG: hypothetical protein DRO64_07395 [Candidatus Bathyarchaeota archaeon]